MRRRWTVAVIVGLIVAAAAIGYAQQIVSGYYGYTPPRWPTANTFKGAFNMCRVMFTSNRREKRGWDTDYPGADINFSVRLSELTRTRITRQSHHRGQPEHVVVRLTDQTLFQCPFVLMEDAGTAVFNDQEVKQLHEYFLKGGFAFVSDYWGDRARDQFDQQIGRALPREEFPVIDLPVSHPIWHTQFELKYIPQMSSIQSWRRSGGNTERGVQPGTVTARGIADAHGRLMVVMMHNTDIPDGWEREGEDREYFLRFSPDAYSVGIDVLLYALTH